MSEENVEIVRQYFAAYDEGGLDALAEFWDPEITWRAVEGYLDDVGVMRGPQCNAGLLPAVGGDVRRDPG